MARKNPPVATADFGVKRVAAFLRPGSGAGTSLSWPWPESVASSMKRAMSLGSWRGKMARKPDRVCGSRTQIAASWMYMLLAPGMRVKLGMLRSLLCLQGVFCVLRGLTDVLGLCGGLLL